MESERNSPDMESTVGRRGRIGLARQLVVGVGMTAVAIALILLFHTEPLGVLLRAGLPWPQQLALGLGIGGLAALGSYIGLLFQSKHHHTRSTIQSYSRLDLRGLNPVWIAVAAGIGEELLFRGALQPLLGIWLTSVLFVLAHVRAYQFKSINRTTAIQAGVLFVTSLALGFIFQHVGLIAAMLTHAAIDIAGLYAVRGACREPSAQNHLRGA